MKNIFLSFLIMLMAAVSTMAQETARVNEVSGFANITDASNMADQIVKAAGLKANFTIAEANVQNALAVVQQGKRYILYNPRFIELLTKATGTKWAAVSVLAHEIGHHLYHKPGSKTTGLLSSELEADEFSGFVLEKMGATLPEAQIAMKMLATTYATRTHPGRDDRVNSIAAGWKAAGGIAAPTADDDEPVASTTPAELSIPRASIAAEIHFDATPNAGYYVTTRLNVIKVTSERAYMIAKIARSTSSEYPYIIYDGSGFRLYVNNSGTIVDSDGKVVGTMKAGG